MDINMTLLNRYKARILKQLNITHEAWWDDWYDKTFDDEYFDKGPIDVWEEPALPKELGVKSPVWTELLTRGDDDMFPYRNIGGNSGVAEYDSGVDWFLIKFKDGSLYLYTHKSTLPEHIYRMRQLAESGIGLNAYVNHMYHRHGIQYAGRNYKGNLTLTPGIESIGNHKGIRALQLIIAFQNTLRENNMSNTISTEKFEELKQKSGKDGLEPNAEKALKIALQLLGKPQASNEGIWGAVRYLFGGNYEDLPKINAAYDEAVDAVKSTYGNPEWVKKRRLNEGTVKVKGYSKVAENPQAMFDAVKKNNQKAFEEAQDYVKGEVEYLSKYVAALNAPEEKVKALLDMFDVHPAKDLQQAPEMDLGRSGEVKAKDASGIGSAAEVFYNAVKYRRATDAIFTCGLYKLAYTDSGKARYGRDGIETARLEGPAKELSLKIGQVLHNVQQSFYNSFSLAWDNIDGVVRGSLFIMEASAD